MRHKIDHVRRFFASVVLFLSWIVPKTLAENTYSIDISNKAECNEMEKHFKRQKKKTVALTFINGTFLRVYEKSVHLNCGNECTKIGSI